MKNESDELMYVTTEHFKIKQLLDEDKVGGELSEKMVKNISSKFLHKGLYIVG